MSYQSQYPPEQNFDYVKATSYLSIDFYSFFATDPTKSLIGDMVQTSWISDFPLASQRFHIDLGETKIIKRIYYENFHDFGGGVDRGVKNFTFWGSNSSTAFEELTYGIDTNWVQLPTEVSLFDEHAALDQVDPKYILVNNSTPYRYYAFKFVDNWGYSSFMGVRRIELQSEYVSQKNIISNTHIKTLNNQKTITSNTEIVNILPIKTILSDAHIKTLDNQETIISDTKIIDRNKKTITSDARIVLDILMEFSLSSDIRFGKSELKSISIGSDIRFGKEEKFVISSDIRFSDKSHEKTTVRPITDFCIKLDGVELTDANLESGEISYNLGTEPSRFNVTLARRHDNLDYTIDGIFSEITNENKIEVYDGIKKIFTGYVAEIHANSESDTVDIVVFDNRYKLSRVSPIKICYGYFSPEDRERLIEEGNVIYLSNADVLKYVLDLCVSEGYISNYESSILSDLNINVEGKEITNTYDNIINEILKEVITADWYLDENEVLRFVKLNQGNIVNLNLANLNKIRTIYDVILSDVILTRQKSTYITGLRVTHGKKFTNKYTLIETYWSLPIQYILTNKPRTFFSFQTFGNTKRYIGEGVTNYGFSSTGGGILIPSFITQIRSIDTSENIEDSIIGIGNNKKTLNFDNFSVQKATPYYEERGEDDGSNWLYKIIPSNYSLINYANDLANFELKQNNQLLTTSTVSLFFDNYLINNINFSKRINLDNTIEPNIYKNNNQFPLNIESMTLTLKDRLINLHLTNYGAEFAKRVINYDSGITNEYREIKTYKKVSTLLIEGF
jgi:hypothetical protein